MIFIINYSLLNPRKFFFSFLSHSRYKNMFYCLNPSKPFLSSGCKSELIVLNSEQA